MDKTTDEQLCEQRLPASGMAADATLPIVQYWHDESVPEDVAALLATHREHNPHFRHLVFSRSTAEELIAEHLGVRELDAFRACAVPAMQADYLRYCAIYALGGVYSDADSHCVSSLTPLVEPAGGRIFEGPERGHLINSHFAFSAPGHLFLRLSIDIATINIEHRLWSRVEFAVGQFVFKMLVLARRAPSAKDRMASLRARYGGRSFHVTRRPIDSGYLDDLERILGDDALIARAFEGVRVLPRSDLRGLIEHGDRTLAYRRTADHFPYFRGSIYC